MSHPPLHPHPKEREREMKDPFHYNNKQIAWSQANNNAFILESESWPWWENLVQGWNNNHGRKTLIQSWNNDHGRETYIFPLMDWWICINYITDTTKIGESTT